MQYQDFVLVCCGRNTAKHKMNNSINRPGGVVVRGQNNEKTMYDKASDEETDWSFR